MRNINFIIFLFLSYQNGKCQTITPQVLNSAGQAYTTSINGVYLTDNIGEPFTETLGPSGNIIITQGFLQPDMISVLGTTITTLKNDITCTGKNDGNISTALSNIKPGSQITYSWTPATVCPSGNCSSLDSLKAGDYSLVVIVNYTNAAGPQTDTLKSGNISIRDENGPCRVKIFTGVTPNGDNINDTWIIENIEEFPNNKVTIFNRWGTKIFDTNNYHNLNNAWPKKDGSDNFTPSTYFYIIDLGDGSKPLKGWVELIKN